MSLEQPGSTGTGGVADSPQLDDRQREVVDAYQRLAGALSGPENGYDVLEPPTRVEAGADYGVPDDWTTRARTLDEADGSLAPGAGADDDVATQQVLGLGTAERAAMLKYASSGDTDGLVARLLRSSGTTFLDGLSSQQVADVLGGLGGGPVARDLGRSMAHTDPRRTAEVVAAMQPELAAAFMRALAGADVQAAGEVVRALAEQRHDETDQRVLYIAGDRGGAAAPVDGVHYFDRLGTQDLRRILYCTENTHVCLAVVRNLGRDGVVRLLEFDPSSVASLLTRAGDVPTTARVLADLKADHSVQVLSEMTDDEATDHLRHMPPALRLALLRRMGPPRSTALAKKLQQQ